MRGEILILTVKSNVKNKTETLMEVTVWCGNNGKVSRVIVQLSVKELLGGLAAVKCLQTKQSDMQLHAQAR